jgi:hypothetical protein
MSTSSQDSAVPDGDYASLIIREMGLIFSNASLYGATHQVTLKAFKTCLAGVHKQLDAAPEILFTLVEDHLLVDSLEIESKGPGQQVLINQLTRLGVNGFSLMHGLTLEEFANFVEILSGKAEKIMAQGGLAQLLERKAITHVRAKQVTFKAVAEDEAVVSKDRVSDQPDGPRDLAVTAFLEAALKDGRSPAVVPEEGLKAAAEDIPHLAGLVLQVAQSPAGEDPTLPEDLNDRIVTCLKTLCHALQQDSSAKSATGKKALAKILSELGDQIRLLMSGGDSAKPLDEAIGTALEVMTDNLQVDALTAEYMKKRAAIDKSEKRMLKLVRSAETPEALAELQERLSESGMTIEEWTELVARGRPPANGDKPRLAMLEKLDAGVFRGLLTRLNERLTSLEEPGQDASLGQIQEVMKSLDEEMEALVTRVEKKIQTLSETEEERAEAEQAKTDALARRRMRARQRRLEVIAEIAQEFCQPLTVISSTLEMIRQCRAGTITDQQGALLSLAARSSDRMDGLINDLIDICGMPDSTTPMRTETSGTSPSTTP